MATQFHGGRTIHLTDYECRDLEAAVKGAVLLDSSTSSNRVLCINIDPAYGNLVRVVVEQLLGRAVRVPR